MYSADQGVDHGETGRWERARVVMHQISLIFASMFKLILRQVLARLKDSTCVQSSNKGFFLSMKLASQQLVVWEDGEESTLTHKISLFER
jgi:hypothetical protein